MNIDERKNKILELLNENGSVKVEALSKLFDISEVTVRSDLADMEYKGLLTRIHGGAVSSYKPYYSMNLNQRLAENAARKKAIAEKTASMVENGDTLMLNSGTTTLLVFRALSPSLNLNIVTNSIPIALEAADNPNFNILLLGGSINSKYQFTFGDDAIRQLKNYHADKLILSVDGVDLQGGFSTYYDKEAEIDRIMLSQSNLSIIAADFSKFNREAFTKICDLNSADCIVTNDCVPPEQKKEINDMGIKLFVV